MVICQCWQQAENQMTSQEVRNIIKSEMRSEPDINSKYGADVSNGLLEPIKQKYKAANDSKETYERWTVFTERQDKKGYLIYFDEESTSFGLAVQSDDPDELVDIGIYGTFLRTLYSM